jgi:hypothetical protein
MASRFEYAQAFDPNVNRWYVSVPCLAHKSFLGIIHFRKDFFMKINRQCPACGITYEAEAKRLKFGRQTTCSRDCSYRLRTSKRENRITLSCRTCGNEFQRTASHVKGKHGSNFCSRACHYAGRSQGTTLRIVTSPYNVTEKGRLAWFEGAKKTRELRIARNNYKHSDATKAKLSEKTSLALASGKIRGVSKVEDLVAAELDRIGVKHVRQFAIRSNNGTFAFVFDFLIGDDIALEVQGTYWHADPRFFPDGPTHEIQKRNAFKWARKLAECASRNIRVIEVWEYDIKKDIRKAIAEALNGLI